MATRPILLYFLQAIFCSFIYFVTHIHMINILIELYVYIELMDGFKHDELKLNMLSFVFEMI